MKNEMINLALLCLRLASDLIHRVYALTDDLECLNIHEDLNHFCNVLERLRDRT